MRSSCDTFFRSKFLSRRVGGRRQEASRRRGSLHVAPQHAAPPPRGSTPGSAAHSHKQKSDRDKLRLCVCTSLAESAVERVFAANRPAPFAHRRSAKNSMGAPVNWGGSAQKRCGGMGTRVRGKRGNGRASMRVVVLVLCLMPNTCFASWTFLLRCRATFNTLNPHLDEKSRGRSQTLPQKPKPLNLQLNPRCWM